jgi:3-oxoacyl-(acyl-carrier-protein) synthase
VNVYVTGIGIISSLGEGVYQNFHALRSEQSGIRYSQTHQLYLGEVQRSNEFLAEQLNSNTPHRSRTDLLGAIAAAEAWGKNRQTSELRTALISSTSVGGVDKMESFFLESLSKGNRDNFHLMTYDNSSSTEYIAELLEMQELQATISTACSSGANAIMQGGRYIEHGLADRVLAGGVDPVSLFNIKGFSSLNIYDSELCRPFDETRAGLNMGEGAAYLVLESQKSLDISGNEPICWLSGWGNASDAYHQTGSSPEGIGSLLSMKASLDKASLLPAKLSYVNAHGTGTENNDLSESRAMLTLFDGNLPPFSSTKAFTGHTLAAAGAMEAVFCVLSIQHQCLFPNFNFNTPMKETDLVPVRSFEKDTVIKHVLSNSFGFGGNCTSLIFSKI